jgi:hypothetical protein
MKRFWITGIMFFFTLIAVSNLTDQRQGRSLNGMSFNGATGLYSIPSARICWERPNNFGFNLGYHMITSGGMTSHIPKLNTSLFNWVELHAALDLQPPGHITSNRGNDLILGAKIQFPLTNTALALGGNFQSLNLLNNDGFNHNAGQVYLALTYTGRFFNSPADTTVVFGKTFRENTSNSDIDFGMGFELMILPQYLGGLVYWVTDFSNFSYSIEPFGADAWYRGVINSGLRFDFSIIPIFQRLKFVVDIVITDAFDSNRAFSAGVVLGVPFL